MRKRMALSSGLVLVVAALSAGIAIAAGGDDERSLTGSTLEKVTAAALEHTGGGTVTDTEVGDDGTAYGVEVRLVDGTEVEVQLDADFEVVGQEIDDDGTRHEDNGDEDEARG